MASEGYGAIQGTPARSGPAPAVRYLFLASFLAIAGVVAVVVASAASDVNHAPMERMQLVDVPAPTRSVMLKGIFNTAPSHVSQLSQALDRVVAPAQTFQLVDHAQLATLLKEHLLARQQGLSSYPFGYPRSGGWHQVIENYDPKGDGCDCSIDEGDRELRCSCGSVWGAITLMDEGCYGCCANGCCNHCHCTTLAADGREVDQDDEEGDYMGPTSCSCPLAEQWRWSTECSWWSDNAGPLDPGGTGGIPEVEDVPGVLP